MVRVFLCVYALKLSLVFTVLCGIMGCGGGRILELLLKVLVLVLLLLSVLQGGAIKKSLVGCVPLCSAVTGSSFKRTLTVPGCKVVCLFCGGVLALLDPGRFAFVLNADLIGLLPMF